jgi:hypothetical protein
MPDVPSVHYDPDRALDLYELNLGGSVRDEIAGGLGALDPYEREKRIGEEILRRMGDRFQPHEWDLFFLLVRFMDQKDLKDLAGPLEDKWPYSYAQGWGVTRTFAGVPYPAINDVAGPVKGARSNMVGIKSAAGRYDHRALLKAIMDFDKSIRADLNPAVAGDWWDGTNIKSRLVARQLFKLFKLERAVGTDAEDSGGIWDLLKLRKAWEEKRDVRTVTLDEHLKFLRDNPIRLMDLNEFSLESEAFLKLVGRESPQGPKIPWRVWRHFGGEAYPIYPEIVEENPITRQKERVRGDVANGGGDYVVEKPHKYINLIVADSMTSTFLDCWLWYVMEELERKLEARALKRPEVEKLLWDENLGFYRREVAPGGNLPAEVNEPLTRTTSDTGEFLLRYRRHIVDLPNFKRLRSLLLSKVDAETVRRLVRLTEEGGARALSGSNAVSLYMSDFGVGIDTRGTEKEDANLAAMLFLVGLNKWGDTAAGFADVERLLNYTKDHPRWDEKLVAQVRSALLSRATNYGIATGLLSPNKEGKEFEDRDYDPMNQVDIFMALGVMGVLDVFQKEGGLPVSREDSKGGVTMRSSVHEVYKKAIKAPTKITLMGWVKRLSPF